MADTVTIAGHKVNKWVVWGGVAGAAFMVYLWIKNRNSSSSATTTTSASSIDPVTGLPYSEDNTVDPLTGMTYLEEATEYGSVAAAEQEYESESSAADEYDSGLAYGEPAEGEDYYANGSETTTTYTTNSQWTQAVIAGLTALGYNASDVGAAIGLYLLSEPLTSEQVTIVQTAVAEYGPPPVGTFSIIASTNDQTGSTSTSSGGTGSTGSTTTTTSSTSKPITVAPTGFRVVSVTNGDNVNLAWNALTPPAGEGPLTGYMIAYGPTSGSQQYKQQVGGQTTSATVAGVGAGSAGKHYFELWALPAKTGGPHAGPIEASTTKS